MSPGRDGTLEEGRLRPPPLGLLLAEARGLFELNASLLLSPLLMRAPRGDGHPVLALPGFLASDLSMAPMQAAVMEKLQQQVLSNIEKVSPESLIQSWFTFDPKLAERFQDMFVTMAGLGSPRSADKKK